MCAVGLLFDVNWHIVSAEVVLMAATVEPRLPAATTERPAGDSE
jgi:hypothetical protein